MLDLTANDVNGLDLPAGYVFPDTQPDWSSPDIASLPPTDAPAPAPIAGVDTSSVDSWLAPITRTADSLIGAYKSLQGVSYNAAATDLNTRIAQKQLNVTGTAALNSLDAQQHNLELARAQAIAAAGQKTGEKKYGPFTATEWGMGIALAGLLFSAYGRKAKA